VLEIRDSTLERRIVRELDPLREGAQFRSLERLKRTVAVKLYKFFIDAGVLLRPLGNVVYILPPYPISAAELNFIYDRIVESLALR